MALLAASTTTTTTQEEDPTQSSVSLRPQQSDLVHRYALELGSALQGSALLVFAQHFSRINRLALTYLLFGCNLVALQTAVVAREIVAMAVAALSSLVWNAWDSKQGRRLRKKLEFEFFVLILGTGNGLILAVLWPGWILVALMYFLYLLCSWVG